jgi:hypothetical protein
MQLTEKELKMIFDKIAMLYKSQKVFIASRLILNGLWQKEVLAVAIEDYDFKTRTLLIRGKRQRRVIIDTTTSQMMRLLSNKRREGRIIELSDNRLSMCYSEVCKECNIRTKKFSSDLRNTFISLSIEKGRNAASVYAQAGQPLKGISIPTIGERGKDFDSKPII